MLSAVYELSLWNATGRGFAAHLTLPIAVLTFIQTPFARTKLVWIVRNEQNLRTYDDNFARMLKINGYFTINGRLYLSKPPLGFGWMPHKHAGF